MPTLALTDSFSFTAALILAGVLGLCVGSYLNVVVYRLPRGMRLAYPPSHCTACGYRLQPLDNVPLLSYLALGGKCRKCRAHISVRYPIVESANAALWIAAILLFRYDLPTAITAAIASSIAICVFCIDAEHGVIPNRFSILLATLSIPATLFDRTDAWYTHLIGATAGWLIFYALKRAVSRRIGREALGLGDVKFSTAAGAFLGWKRGLLAVLISSVSAAAVLLLRRAGDRTEKSGEIPFGPFLSVGLVVACLLGDTLIPLYLSLF